MSHLLNPNRSFTIPNPPPQQPPPKENAINVLDLTLLLKVMGFRLNYLDYEEGVTSSTDVTVEIRCGTRNLLARLSASGEQCACPAKREDQANDSSFWEILGTAPSSSPGKKQIEETSSNLLPELSKRGLANTKQLLSLIFVGFHKDHLPSSPEQRVQPAPLSIHTSTQVKSPRMQEDHLEGNVPEGVSPRPLTAPPNTPKVGAAPGGGMGFVTHLRPNGSSFLQSSRHRDHLAYMQVVAAKEQLEKALLSMKMNIVDEFGQLYGPPLNLSTQKLFEEVEEESPQSKATFKRRSSMGSFPNLKAKGDAVNKLKSPLVRNKSSIDAGAALKAKNAAATVTSRYLLPKKPVAVATKPTPSPLGSKKPLGATAKGPLAKKSPAATGWK